MKFAKWLFFGVCLALAPLVADYFIQSNRTAPGAATDWRLIIAKGELLLVSAAIAAAAIGELIGSGQDWLLLKVIAGVGCLMLLIVTSELYASTASDLRANVAYNVENLVSNSRILFYSTLAAAGGCVLLGE